MEPNGKRADRQIRSVRCLDQLDGKFLSCRMLRDPIGGSRKLLSVVCSPIGGAELGHVHARGRDRQDEPTHSGLSLERDAGRDDAAHGLGHQVDGTINRNVDKPDKIVNVEIMGLVAEARPVEECFVPLARQSFATGCQNPGEPQAPGRNKIFFILRQPAFQGDPLLGVLAAGGGTARHRRNKVGIPQKHALGLGPTENTGFSS
jgi:hypothetical protein